MKIPNFLNSIKHKFRHQKHILFLEFWNATPHLQTALELAIKHANHGEQVTFLFGGHDVLFIERDINFKHNPMDPLKLLPEESATRLVKHKKIEFQIKLKIPKLIIHIPKFKSIDELDNVSGIGKATIDKFRELITVN